MRMLPRPYYYINQPSLIEAMSSLHLRYGDLADALGISKSYLDRIVYGRVALSEGVRLRFESLPQFRGLTDRIWERADQPRHPIPRPRTARVTHVRYDLPLFFIRRDPVSLALCLRGLSQREIAVQLGISRVHWSHLFNRHAPVSARVRAAMRACPVFEDLADEELWEEADSCAREAS